MSAAAKVVGVLGGMGPAATVDFMQRVLAATGAARDADHLRMIVDCNPLVPDRNAAVAGTGPSPGPVLASMAQGLERAGAQLLAMPCNTAHAFLADVRAATALPIVDIVEETVRALGAMPRPPRAVGLLATTGTVDAGLYQRALEHAGIRPVVPTGEARGAFMAVLARIKGGDVGVGSRAAMRDVALALVAAGADAIVAACTEVPLVLDSHDLDVPLLNSTDCLVAATVRTARGG